MSIATLRHTTPPLVAEAGWRLPSGQPLQRYSLCSLARPYLRTPQQLSRFHFYEATLLLVLSGQLTLLERGETSTQAGSTARRKTTVVDSPARICLIAPDTSTDLTKIPGAEDGAFRSIFMTFSSTLLTRFYLRYPDELASAHRPPPVSTLEPDSDLIAALQHVVDGITHGQLNDARLELRLLELLLVLAERGYHFGVPSQPSVTTQLRALIGEHPEQHWTAQSAGRWLAMSEATLRRRLSAEQTHFETVLLETRMQHAMILVQTTSWNMQRLAEACGYQSPARFSARFKAHFGCSPAGIR